MSKNIFESLFSNEKSLDIDQISRAAQFIRNALTAAGHRLRPGISTGELAGWADRSLKNDGADSGWIIHVSPEEAVCHGIPGSRILSEGQIVTIDAACSSHGWWADMAVTLPVGRVGQDSQRLLRAACEGTWQTARHTAASSCGTAGWKAVKAVAARYSVNLIKDACGHGIGRQLHREPCISYTGEKHEPLREGWIYAVEPLFTLGSGRISLSKSGSIETEDGSPAAHFEICVQAMADYGKPITAPLLNMGKLSC